ncbi:hypothetical protein C2S52_010789 [Perilla frutescens var. hirtella]|nr:hypothetical protein C2S52_010789 [Perilla frutescens var. hirtella]
MAVAVDQGHGFKPFTRPPRCRLQSFTQLDYKMLDLSQSKLGQSLENDYGFSNIHKSYSTPCLSNSSPVKDDHDTTSRIEIIIGHAAPRVRALVVEVAIAMASGVKPEPASSGLGGAYFLRAQNGDTIAVAKPIDEEPLAFNNPKGLAGRLLGQPGMKCSIRIGETGMRESAAYVLDHDGFAGVPPTALVRFSHVKFNINNPGSDSTTIYKVASLQRYVKHDSDAGDLGPSSFSVTCVHHIGILDVRLMNLDRHAGNILVRHGQESYAGGSGTAELVPIDHGFCLPEALDDPYFEWLHWPQASIPFSEAEVDYISGLDPYKDAELLRTVIPSIGESSVRVLVLCTIFLKQATAYGLCLADIALNIPEKVENSPREGKPSKIRRFSSMVRFADPPQLGSSKIEDYLDDDQDLDTFLDKCATNVDDHDHGGDDNNPKAGGSLMRSVSYSVPNYNRDGQCIYFGEMDEEEWQSFLENFQKLLPEAFEERKSMDLPKHRLGSSCEF